MCHFNSSDGFAPFNLASDIFGHVSEVIEFEVLFHHILFLFYSTGGCNNHIIIHPCDPNY